MSSIKSQTNEDTSCDCYFYEGTPLSKTVLRIRPCVRLVSFTSCDIVDVYCGAIYCDVIGIDRRIE
jgi:hypothetical protein